MSEKIIIASGKGGVGKSTLTAFLGPALAKRGRRVLLVDSDTGLGALDIMLGVADRVVNSWADVMVGNCEFGNAVIKLSDNLHLLPSPRVFPKEVPDSVFSDVLKSAEKDYDVIFIDSAAGIDDNFRRAALYCERAVFVATADEVSVRCASAAADEAMKYNILRDDMRIVINRFQKKAALKAKLLNVDGVIDKSGVGLLGIIPEDKKVPFISVTNDLPKGKSSLVSAVDRIADRLEGKYVPLDMRKFR